jgi:hypothetical protein
MNELTGKMKPVSKSGKIQKARWKNEKKTPAQLTSSHPRSSPPHRFPFGSRLCRLGGYLF